MNVARQISRRLGRSTGTWARSAEKYCNMSLATGVVSDGRGEGALTALTKKFTIHFIR